MINERFGNKGELEFDVPNFEGAIDWCIDFNAFFRGKPRQDIENAIWKTIERRLGGFSTDLLEQARKIDLDEACGVFYKVDKIIDHFADQRPVIRSPYKINFFVRPGRTPVQKLVEQEELDLQE